MVQLVHAAGGAGEEGIRGRERTESHTEVGGGGEGAMW